MCPEECSCGVFWHNTYLQVRLGWKMMQLWKANSLIPLHTTWDVSPDCCKVTSSTHILPSHVAAHNNTLPNPPLHTVLSPHSFCLFSCLSGAVTGSSSFAPLISTNLTLPSSLRRLHQYSAGDCFCAQSFLIKILVHCWFTGVSINPCHIISAFMHAWTIAVSCQSLHCKTQPILQLKSRLLLMFIPFLVISPNFMSVNV